GPQRRPRELDAFAGEECLEGFEELRTMSDCARYMMPLQAERGEQAGRFANIPFDGMNAERAVRDVRNAQVLAAGQQILDPDGQHGPEGDLKRPTADVEVAAAADPRMEIDPVAADAHRVAKQFRSPGSQRMDLIVSPEQYGGYLATRAPSPPMTIRQAAARPHPG